MRLMDPPACEPLLLIRRIRQKQSVVKRNGDDTTEVNEDECNNSLSDGSHCAGHCDRFAGNALERTANCLQFSNSGQ